jgi:hypothetical protein
MNTPTHWRNIGATHMKVSSTYRDATYYVEHHTGHDSADADVHFGNELFAFRLAIIQPHDAKRAARIHAAMRAWINGLHDQRDYLASRAEQAQSYT